jgi:hypothetical protein
VAAGYAIIPSIGGSLILFARGIARKGNFAGIFSRESYKKAMNLKLTKTMY